MSLRRPEPDSFEKRWCFLICLCGSEQRTGPVAWIHVGWLGVLEAGCTRAKGRISAKNSAWRNAQVPTRSATRRGPCVHDEHLPGHRPERRPQAAQRKFSPCGARVQRCAEPR